MKKTVICGVARLFLSDNSIQLTDANGGLINIEGSLVNAAKKAGEIDADDLYKIIPCQICISIQPVGMVVNSDPKQDETLDPENDSNDNENEEALQEQLRAEVTE